MTPVPLISVVIPCYNHGQFLGGAIASVGRSSQTSVEIIVVDDGSVDDTAAVAQASPGTRCISQPNAGPAHARNRGLQESRGRLLVFLDADDCLAPGALDVGVAEIEAHPTAAFVFGRCRMMAPDGTLMPTTERPRIERDHYRELLRRNHLWTLGTAMFRRDAVERAGGFDPTVQASSDYSLALRIARTNPVHDHCQVVAYYRRHTSSKSGNAARMLHESLTVLSRERPFVEGDPALLAAYYDGWRGWQEYYGNHLVDEIRGHVGSGEWIRAARKTAVLGWLHPQGLTQHTLRKLALTLRIAGRTRNPGV